MRVFTLSETIDKNFCSIILDVCSVIVTVTVTVTEWICYTWHMSNANRYAKRYKYTYCSNRAFIEFRSQNNLIKNESAYMTLILMSLSPNYCGLSNVDRMVALHSLSSWSHELQQEGDNRLINNGRISRIVRQCMNIVRSRTWTHFP